MVIIRKGNVGPKVDPKKEVAQPIKTVPNPLTEKIITGSIDKPISTIEQKPTDKKD